jgi:carboxyl-terminal processing protease
VRFVPVLSWTMWLPLLMQDIDAALFAARDADGVIFDLRGNPGGVVGMIGGVAGHFTDSATNLGTMRGRGSTMNLRTNPRVVNRAGERVPIISAPVAILVDEFSASTTEFFTAGLQGLGRARVFGTTSSGQALPALMLRLPNGDVLMHPIADHVDATGRTVEGTGIVPDEATPLRRRDLVNGRDAAMDAARAWLTRVNR